MAVDKVEFRSDVKAIYVDGMGDDKSITMAARVEEPRIDFRVPRAPLFDKDKGLMRMLMRDRHGTPWEHVVFTFYIEAPIFVAREAHRHRIASINEESGRYKELGPVFYIPSDERNLQQIGKPGAYQFLPGNDTQVFIKNGAITKVSKEAYAEYQFMLSNGIAREVARMVLPVNIFTSWYLTINLRSLFNFLSLRTVTDDTTVPTFPQFEIQMLADQMEEIANVRVPYAMQCFRENGRVSP